VDYDEIVWITSRLEFPWDYLQGTGIAFLRDYGIPSISCLLDQTREFEDHGVKRYDDTLLIGQEATTHGVDSEQGRAAVRRLNRIHGHYDIPNDEFQYVLATTIVGPVRWISKYGWRRLDQIEVQALANFTTRFGELMGISGLPTTYDGYLQLLVDYERRRFAFDPANRRLAEATLRIGRRTATPAYLRPFVRTVTIALMDRPLREALGLPGKPRWLTGLVEGGLRQRGRLLRFAGARSVPSEHRPSSYPLGFGLGDLGPASMLDELNRSGSRSSLSRPHIRETAG
jgi:hypothetical protein